MLQQHQKPIAKWNSGRDCWETDQVDLLSGLSDVYSETFTISGSMRNGVAYEHQMSGHLMGASGSLFSQLGGKLLRTPMGAEADGGPSSGTDSRARIRLSDQVEKLLPSPVAQPSGNRPDDHLRKKPGREVVTDLAIIVENGLLETGGKLLPTPRADEATGIGIHGTGGQDLRTSVALLPTPDAYAGSRGGAQDPEKRRAGGHSVALHDVVEKGNVRPQGGPTWGPYGAAIERWETVLGRSVPEPTEQGPKGGQRLSAVFVEWMMGLPEGWVTDPALELSRTQQLKMLGNGVVVQQATSALLQCCCESHGFVPEKRTRFVLLRAQIHGA